MRLRAQLTLVRSQLTKHQLHLTRTPADNRKDQLRITAVILPFKFVENYPDRDDDELCSARVSTKLAAILLSPAGKTRTRKRQ